MLYIVSAYINGHWQTILTTKSREYAMAFYSDLEGVRAKIEVPKK
jgi:hypothetical protein